MASLIQYNGISILGELSKTRFRSTPVYDDAGWTVKHVVHSISTDTIIQADIGTGLTLQQIHSRLMRPGQALLVSGKGWGGALINVAGTRDVDWGPKPRVQQFTPLGGGRAARLIWECEVAIPRCPGATAYQFAIASFSFDIDIEIDHEGMTTRTISGSLEIPNTRRPGGQIQDNPDVYRDRFRPTVPTSFKRESQRHRTSRDRKRWEFSFVDREIHSNNPYPQNMTNVQVSHRVTSVSNSDGSVPVMSGQWFHSISGTISTQKGVSQSLAYQKALLIIKDRLLHANQNAKLDNGDGYAMPHSLTIEEEIFGNQLAFSFTFRQWTKLTDILTASGLWRPVPGANWDRWRITMEEQAWRNRGVADLRLGVGQDFIIDLCQQGAPANDMDAFVPKAPPNIFDAIDIQPPSADESWLEYSSWIQFDEQNQTAQHRTYDIPASSAGVQGIGRGEIQKVSFAPSTPSTIQTLAPPKYSVWLFGKAMRGRYPIRPPRIDSWGQSPAVQAERRFVQSIVGFAGGFPLIGAAWAIRYYLESPPSVDFLPRHDLGTPIV